MSELVAPLAERMRPKRLEDVIGQEHITGNGSILQSALASKLVPSMIFWGPPGVGKTTLAQIVAQEAGLPFFQLSAINSGVKEIREVIELSKKQSKTVVFIDEIHRFNKSQQDALLQAVEKGWIILIGATTENPSFEVNAALLSRCQVYVLKHLETDDLIKLIQKVLDQDIILSTYQLKLKEHEAILSIASGDGRKLLNLVELVAQYAYANGIPEITNDIVLKVAQQKIAIYDKQGEQHYDIISAFIKSVRGSDPNGAIYWLARMIEGGENIRFIARRMIILASEDIGNANPNALLLANSCFEAVDKIGLPEARIILAQCATYLAASPKSNASYLAIDYALDTIRKNGQASVPLHLRNAPTNFMKNLDYGKNYQYSHDGPGNFIEQEYLPDELRGTKFYEPGNSAREQEIKKFLKDRWKNKYGY
ncbi:MAG: replication-associated recombination protein A [Hydrotalea sp.]|nr:replication-associated recombination protein A [Hydrotalea sp.]